MPILNSINQATQVLHWPVVHTALFLIALHSFFRISNLLPTSASKFNIWEHLSRDSIRFAPPGVHITITWSKKLKAASSHNVIQLAAMPGSPLCPVNALNAVFFQITHSQNWLPYFHYHSTMVTLLSHSPKAGLPFPRWVLVNWLIRSMLFAGPGCFGFFSGGSHAIHPGSLASQAVWAYLRNSSNPQILTTAISNHVATF